jgi:TonB-linked SusC/RagA family outer membrane protein
MRKTFMLIAMLFAFLCTQQALAQEKTIKGKVISSEDNLGIPGVSVIIPGTTTGTVTDIDGNYTLSVPAETKSLRFTAVGMATQEVEIGDKTTIDLTMKPSALQMDEVIVTANAIEREKRSLGYSTKQVSSTDLNAAENPNVIGALQGKVAGVNITSLTGGPGSSQRIVIRGGTSITGANQPIMVVDGVPINNANIRTGDDLNNQVDFGNRGNDINPDDIESISVLKGPAAAALYGSRASNGAIMITTKKGKRVAGTGKSKMDVEFHSNLTLSSVLKLPEFQNKYGQGDVDNTYDDRRENFSWGLPFDGQLRPWGQEIDGKQRVKNYEAIENNMRDFFETGVTYTNSLAFSGGSEKSDYLLSISALNSDGIVPSSEYDKYTVHFNGGSELSNKFSTNISFNYSNISAVLPSGGQRDASIYDQLLQTPRDIPIVDGKDLEDPFNSYNDVTGQYGFYGGYTTNPYFVLENFKNTQNVSRLIGNVGVTYKANDWFSITNRFGGDFYSDNRYQKWKKYNYAPIDPFYAGNDQIFNGKYSEELIDFSAYNNDLMFNFNHKFTEDLSGDLLLGYNVRQQSLNSTAAQTNEDGGLGIPGYYNLENSNGPVLARNALNKTRNYGYYANLNLAYKNYLFLGLSGRQDNSSTLEPENNSYFYWGTNASFIASEFFSESLREDKFTYWQIRMSYAKVGNDATAYQTSSIYTRTTIDGGFGNTTFPFDGVQGFTTGDRVGNPELTPEFSTELEIGTDVSFLKDRLSVGFSWYKKESIDQIIPLPISPATGFTSKTVNTGQLDNNGIEFEVRGIPVMSKSGFKWEAYGTYFTNNSEVVSLYDGVDQLTLGGTSRTAIVANVGQPMGSFYAVDLLRDSLTGRVVVDSATGMPLTTSNLVYVGNNQPDFQFSFGSNFTYKGFTLGFLFDSKIGGQFSSRTKDVMAFVGTSLESENRDDQVWSESVYLASDGNYVTNTTPYHPYDYYTNVIPDGQHIVDASYIKLRELSLTYQFPGKWLNKTPFGSASLTLFGNNLLLWTKLSSNTDELVYNKDANGNFSNWTNPNKENVYADPEQNSSGASNAQGFEFTSNPSQRNYGIDLKITF